jgi:hypothetical protein
MRKGNSIQVIADLAIADFRLLPSGANRKSEIDNRKLQDPTRPSKVLTACRHPRRQRAISDVGVLGTLIAEDRKVEISKALAALQPLYGKSNVEIITTDGKRVRGIIRSMKTTQALTTPSVKVECPNGEIVKIPFPTIAEIKDHNKS